MIHYIHVSDIEWDTDGEEIPSLPKSILIIVDSDGHKNLYDGDECSIADFLSDSYGWCISRFVAEEYTKDNPKLNEVFANTNEVLLAC